MGRSPRSQRALPGGGITAFSRGSSNRTGIEILEKVLRV